MAGATREYGSVLIVRYIIWSCKCYSPNSIMQLLKNIDFQVTQISLTDVTITTSHTVIGALAVEYFHLDQRLFDNITKSITACGGP